MRQPVYQLLLDHLAPLLVERLPSLQTIQSLSPELVAQKSEHGMMILIPQFGICVQNIKNFSRQCAKFTLPGEAHHDLSLNPGVWNSMEA